MCDGAPDGKGFSLSAPLLHCFLLIFVLKRFAVWLFAVTGLHDMDEFVQSQLILAVSIRVSVSELVFV